MTPERESERVHQAIRALDPDRGVLTGWVLVCEYVTPGDEKILTRRHGPNGTPSWRVDGMLHEALYGEWDNS